jgi:hypothetical protein
LYKHSTFEENSWKQKKSRRWQDKEVSVFLQREMLSSGRLNVYENLSLVLICIKCPVLIFSGLDLAVNIDEITISFSTCSPTATTGVGLMTALGVGVVTVPATTALLILPGNLERQV